MDKENRENTIVSQPNTPGASGEALGRHLKLFVLRPIDIDDRPRETDGPDEPRRKNNAVCGEAKTQRSHVGAENVLETRAGLHDVEQIA